MKIEIENSFVDHPLIEMATIGKTADSYKIAVFGKEGNIPHFHYFDASTDGDKFHSCIRLDKAEYFIHPGKEDKLNSKQRKELVKFLCQKYRNKKINMSNWEFLLNAWNSENENSIQLDDNMSMPDYFKLR